MLNENYLKPFIYRDKYMMEYLPMTAPSLACQLVSSFLHICMNREFKRDGRFIGLESKTKESVVHIASNNFGRLQHKYHPSPYVGRLMIQTHALCTEFYSSGF